MKFRRQSYDQSDRLFHKRFSFKIQSYINFSCQNIYITLVMPDFFFQREHMFSIRGLYIYTKVCVIVLCAVALIRFNQNFGVLNSICFYTFAISPTTFFFLLSLFLEGGPCKLNNSTRETITVPAPVVLLGVPNLALLLSVAFFSQAM